MDNFYNSNDNFPPQTPPYYEQPQRYQGSSSCASASLILGILSLLSICCMPPLALVFAGLALILGALSKGDRTRPQNARVGMILSGISLIAVLILLAVFLVRLQIRPTPNFSSNIWTLSSIRTIIPKMTSTIFCMIIFIQTPVQIPIITMKIHSLITTIIRLMMEMIPMATTITMNIRLHIRKIPGIIM